MSKTTRKTYQYQVYVIELDAAVFGCRKFREANPGHDPAKPPLYVGQSAHPPQTRFEQHRSGIKSNRHAKKHGIRLRMDLAGNLIFKTRREAELAEVAHAEHLRLNGYAVWTN